MSKKKSNSEQVSETKTEAFVFVMNYGLEPRPSQRKALAERAAAWSDATLNGWVQDRKMPGMNIGQVVPLTGRDIKRVSGQWAARTARGQRAIALAKKTGDDRADLFSKSHQPVLTIECNPSKGQTNHAILRAGVTKVSAAHWSAISEHASPALKKAIASDRLLAPDKTEALLRSKDMAVLEDVIVRTQCPDGLRLIHANESTRKNIRKRVIDACDRQGLRLKTPIDFAAQRKKN